jgi:hypothetical protein
MVDCESAKSMKRRKPLARCVVTCLFDKKEFLFVPRKKDYLLKCGRRVGGDSYGTRSRGAECVTR